jgi:hypothetical protein
LARSRFSWKKYPEFPDKGIVRFALEDAKKAKNGHLVDGTVDERWILTQRGIEWIRLHEDALRAFAKQPSRSSVTLVADASLQRVRAHPLFFEWNDKVIAVARPYDVADLAQLTADAPPAAVLQSLRELENAALLSGDLEVKEFVGWLKDGIKQ